MLLSGTTCARRRRDALNLTVAAAPWLAVGATLIATGATWPWLVPASGLAVCAILMAWSSWWCHTTAVWEEDGIRLTRRGRTHTVRMADVAAVEGTGGLWPERITLLLRDPSPWGAAVSFVPPTRWGARRGAHPVASLLRQRLVRAWRAAGAEEAHVRIGDELEAEHTEVIPRALQALPAPARRRAGEVEVTEIARPPARTRSVALSGGAR